MTALAAFVGGSAVTVVVIALTQREPSPFAAGRPDFELVVRHMESISADIALLRREFLELRRASGSQVAHPPDRVMMEQSSMPSDGVAQIERLEQLIRELMSAGGRNEELRIARARNPVPNSPELEALHARLARSATQVDRIAVQQPWLLMGMPEVVQKLGSPTNILSSERAREQSWEYFLADGSTLTVKFVDGLLTSID